ncbi:MAG: hypothetical protein ACE5G2_12515, partial [Candidatus Krumholzibacteriia bacterium]
MLRAWSGLRAALGGRRPASGIEATAHALRAVWCDPGGRVMHSAEVAFAGDSDAAWLDAFRRLRKAAPGAGRRVVCCGPSSWVDALPLRVPATGELEDLLVERARQHLSYPVEEAVLDYVGPQSLTDGTRRALLVAVPRLQVCRLLGAAERSGLRVEVIETAGTALQRALVRLERLDERRTLLVHLDRRHGLFLVVDHEALYVERLLSWGADRFRDVVAAQLDVPAASAERLLRRHMQESAGVAAWEEVRAATDEIVSPVLR